MGTFAMDGRMKKTADSGFNSLFGKRRGMMSRDAEDVMIDDWTDRSFWLDSLECPMETGGEPPKKTDVLIVGSGYTGLNAAIETARGGRKTLVLDAEHPGYGCSTRNGGQISTSVKPSMSQLTARHGEARARAIRDTGKDALSWIKTLIKSEGIDCDLRNSGRFHAAHTPRHYEELLRHAKTLADEDNIESIEICANEQHRELGTDFYHGGLVFPEHAAVDPARYHRGLIEVATGAGAAVVGKCRVLGIEKSGGGFVALTEKGNVQTRDVVIATNGYTGTSAKWLRRRIVPIGSYIIATEPMPRELVERLFPTDRIASDTRKVVYYYRTSPDRRRILFGGRVSANETDTALSGPLLHREMCRIFPEVAKYRISHSWMGTVAYTFDELAHTGMHEGIYHCMGYCGSGVSMASYLGMRTGQKVLGLKEGKTAFDGLPFPTRPFYTGKPWFLPPVVAWYKWLDR